MAKIDSKRAPKSPQTAPDVPAPASPASARPGGGGATLLLRWFIYKTARQASAMQKHVQKLINHQRDILAPQALDALQKAAVQLRAALVGPWDKAAVAKEMENLESAANKWLKPYPNAAWRENFEVLLVALTVAMGIRTFFLQPFKIPTGSMQPTLYGVTSSNLIDEPNYKFPSGLAAARDWFAGASYLHKVAVADGPLTAVDPPFGLRIINLWQSVVVGGQTYTIWFPPDYGEQTLRQRAGIELGQDFKKGQDILRLKVTAGDHLFVDRLTYNFRPPKRGEIVVFETKGIPEDERMRWNIPGDQFYIKRLVGLPNETIALHEDHLVTNAPNTRSGQPMPVGNLVVNGKEITASTPHFENLYSFDGAPTRQQVIPYRENRYFGHAMIGNLADGRQYQIEPGHVFVMGDNTMNSLDSRYWGNFPEQYVIGKAFFVYWPITDRFGWGYH
jgi:signal peptidase I